MHSRLIGILAAFAAVTAIFAASAQATNQAAKYWSTTSSGWKGSRVTVDNPDSSQATVSSGDWILTSAYADDGVSNLIQQGVTYEFKDPENPSCNLGSSSPTLYYFTEKEVNGAYSCYSNGSATFSTSHLQTVDRGSDGVWRAYRDGSATGISTTWSNCGGDACTLAAFAEEDTSKSGAWAAKYAGSGNTEWEWWNGSSWSVINSASNQAGTYWSGPSGPFPGGIWSFTYSH